MVDFITMTCKSCGGKLQISPEIDDFACMYCGTEFKVKREGGIVALSPLVDEMKKVSVSTDKTASELALIRLKDELVISNTQLDREKKQLQKYIVEKYEDLSREKQARTTGKVGGVLAIFIILLLLFALL